jgi:hypothetical protein
MSDPRSIPARCWLTAAISIGMVAIVEAAQSGGIDKVQATPDPSWSVVLTTTTPEVERWEGAFLEIRIQNLRQTPQGLDLVLCGESAVQRLVVTLPDGTLQDLRQVVLLEAPACDARPTPIPPGDTHVELVLAAVDWDRQKPIFDVPGAYSLQVVIDSSSSNPVTIHCRATSSKRQPEFARLVSLRDRDLLDGFYAGHLLSTQRHRETFLELESIALSPAGGWQKDYAAYALGTWWLRKGEGLLDNEQLPRTAVESNGWFDRVAPSSPLIPLVEMRKAELVALQEEAASEQRK